MSQPFHWGPLRSALNNPTPRVLLLILSFSPFAHDRQVNLHKSGLKVSSKVVPEKVEQAFNKAQDAVTEAAKKVGDTVRDKREEESSKCKTYGQETGTEIQSERQDHVTDRERKGLREKETGRQGAERQKYPRERGQLPPYVLPRLPRLLPPRGVSTGPQPPVDLPTHHRLAVRMHTHKKEMDELASAPKILEISPQYHAHATHLK